METLFTFDVPGVGTRTITGNDAEGAVSRLQQRLDSERDESEPQVRVTAGMIESTEAHHGLDEFEAKYTLVSNPANGGDAPPSSCMFETRGDEVEHVNGLDPRNVWTLLDCGDGAQWLSAGRQFVNRLGYFVTEEPWADAGETYLYAA
jgi:hypothetical protein